MSKTNTTEPRVRPYALCDGEGLQVCASCIRNVENQTAPISQHQQWLAPTLGSKGRCADWRAK